jgi:hypothetical protein
MIVSGVPLRIQKDSLVGPYVVCTLLRDMKSETTNVMIPSKRHRHHDPHYVRSVAAGSENIR